MDRQRVHAAGQLTRKCLVNHAVPLDPALSPERLRHDMNPEMGLAAQPVPGVSLVLMRFIHNIEALRRECSRELFGHEGLNLHGTDLCEARAGVNGRIRDNSWKNHLSRLEGVIAISA